MIGSWRWHTTVDVHDLVEVLGTVGSNSCSLHVLDCGDLSDVSLQARSRLAR